MKISSQRQAHIRFTVEEYKRICDDAKLFLQSIPERMKSVYFHKEPVRPVMFPDDARRAIIELNRIGNNVNQIARQLNSGFREGFSPVIDQIKDDIHVLRSFLMGHHGHREN